MTPELLTWVLVAMVFGIGGALSLGLYIGERGRRMATEAWHVNGTTEYGPATAVQQRGRRPSDVPLPPSAEANFSQDTIVKGAELLIEEAKAAGIRVPSQKEAMQQASDLLRMGELVEAESDDLAVTLPMP